MQTRSIYVAAVAAVLFGVASIGEAADEKPMQTMEHQYDISITHLVETAQTAKDHEAVAKRFEDDALAYEKQAAEHARLAAQYRKAPSNPKWNNNAAVLATHCDHLAATLKAAAADARDMAELHHGVAKALANQH